MLAIGVTILLLGLIAVVILPNLGVDPLGAATISVAAGSAIAPDLHGVALALLAMGFIAMLVIAIKSRR